MNLSRKKPSEIQYCQEAKMLYVLSSSLASGSAVHHKKQGTTATIGVCADCKHLRVQGFSGHTLCVFPTEEGKRAMYKSIAH